MEVDQDDSVQPTKAVVQLRVTPQKTSETYLGVATSWSVLRTSLRAASLTELTWNWFTPVSALAVVLTLAPLVTCEASPYCLRRRWSRHCAAHAESCAPASRSKCRRKAAPACRASCRLRPAAEDQYAPDFVSIRHGPEASTAVGRGGAAGTLAVRSAWACTSAEGLQGARRGQSGREIRDDAGESPPGRCSAKTRASLDRQIITPMWRRTGGFYDVAATSGHLGRTRRRSQQPRRSGWSRGPETVDEVLQALVLDDLAPRDPDVRCPGPRRNAGLPPSRSWRGGRRITTIRPTMSPSDPALGSASVMLTLKTAMTSALVRAIQCERSRPLRLDAGHCFTPAIQVEIALVGILGGVGTIGARQADGAG